MAKHIKEGDASTLFVKKKTFIEDYYEYNIHLIWVYTIQMTLHKTLNV